MKNTLYILSILLFYSCDLIDGNHFEVEKELKPFVDSFYAESNKRGLHIQHENLMIYFMPLKGLMGESMTSTTIPTIHIDPGVFNKYLKEKKPLFIEYVVFHELGHAVLYRDHIDYYTIMTSNNKMLTSYAYSENSRRLLLDELFNAKEIINPPKDDLIDASLKNDGLIASECISQSRSII